MDKELSIGGIPIMTIWSSYKKVKKFFDDSTYITCLNAISHVNMNAAIKSFQRAGKSSDPKSDFMIGIGQAQIAYEAYLASARKWDIREHIPFVGAEIPRKRAVAYENAAQVACFISLCYHYVGNKTNRDEYLKEVKENYHRMRSEINNMQMYSYMPPKFDNNPFSENNQFYEQIGYTVDRLIASPTL